MGAKFLCCLPLRLGVLVISLIQFLICGGVAGLLWWALCVNQKNDGNVEIFTKIHAISYLCFSLSRRGKHENDGHRSRCRLYRSCPRWFIRVSTVYAYPT